MPKRKARVSKNQSREVQSLVWEEPPPAYGPHPPGIEPVWPKRLEPLLDAPYQWAKVHTYQRKESAGSTVAKLRQGKVKVPEGKWEFAARGGAVYAQFLGRDDEPPF